jgi:hypothetical protein
MTLSAWRLGGRVAETQAAIADAAARAGRGAEDVEVLVAVKYLEAAALPALHAAGLRLLGENRSDALAEKQAAAEQAGLGLTWDFIGHLQSRKARDVVGRVRLVHALESPSTAAAIERRAERPQDVLVEVNVAGDPGKYGLAPAGLDPFLESLASLGNVRVRGLMTMPPAAAHPDDSRRPFAALRELAARAEERWAPDHRFGVLSMGTSQDYLVAVEEGATIVRLGGALVADAGA